MKNKKFLIISVVGVIAIVAFAVIKSNINQIKESSTVSDSPQIEYYTCGMHPSVKVSPQDYNKGNQTCPICNMKLTPIYKEETPKETSAQGKVLFYRHPMNPSITSKVPAKDEMGMDYIPVYEATEGEANYYGCGMQGQEHVFSIKDVEGMSCPICGMPLIRLSKEEADSLKGIVSRVKIKGEQIRLAGVQTAHVTKLHLYKEIRTVGRVAYDPKLAIAQEEFVSSLKALDKIQQGNISEIKERAENLVESAKRKLILLGLSYEQIEELRQTRKIQTSLILPEEKMWIYGDVYEYELSWLKAGAKVKVTTSSLPGEEFYGVISSVNPVLDPKTRSVRFRAQVNNPDLRLKPEMYVDVIIMSMYSGSEGQREVLAIPVDSVLDTGMRKIVWIDRGDGEYEGREVQIGPEATTTVEGKEGKFYPILKGLSEGEQIVTKANFLIDSQSQITGVAAAAYGGALGAEDEAGKAPMPPGHQH